MLELGENTEFTKTYNDCNSGENDEVLEGEVVQDGEPFLETMSQYLDRNNHTLYINAVNHSNNITTMYKAEAIVKTIFASAFALISIYNIKSILAGDSYIEFFNYVAAIGGTVGCVAMVASVIIAIKNIININKNMNKQNLYVAENYPDEASLVGVPKKIQRLVKKRRKNKKEN